MSTGVRRHQHECLAESAAIAAAVEQLGTFLAKAGREPGQCFRIQVCLAELLNNIAEHAYPPGKAGRILTTLRSTPDLTLAQVTDWSPRAFKAQATSAAALTAETGRGLGILRSWCDHSRRRRIHQRNRVLLVWQHK